jgi:hypothetical protein
LALKLFTEWCIGWRERHAVYLSITHLSHLTSGHSFIARGKETIEIKQNTQHGPAHYSDTSTTRIHSLNHENEENPEKRLKQITDASELRRAIEGISTYQSNRERRRPFLRLYMPFCSIDSADDSSLCVSIVKYRTPLNAVRNKIFKKCRIMELRIKLLYISVDAVSARNI